MILDHIEEFTSENLNLSHEGILGQKWGERNGPPYPLGPGQHSERELRKMRKKELKSLKKARKAKAKKAEKKKEDAKKLSDSKQDILDSMKNDRLKLGKKDLSLFDDEELQQIIGRKKLENLYDETEYQRNDTLQYYQNKAFQNKVMTVEKVAQAAGSIANVVDRIASTARTVNDIKIRSEEHDINMRERERKLDWGREDRNNENKDREYKITRQIDRDYNLDKVMSDKRELISQYRNGEIDYNMYNNVMKGLESVEKGINSSGGNYFNGKGSENKNKNKNNKNTTKGPSVSNASFNKNGKGKNH